MTWELRQKSKRTKLSFYEIIRSIRKDQRKFKKQREFEKREFFISPRLSVRELGNEQTRRMRLWFRNRQVWRRLVKKGKNYLLFIIRRRLSRYSKAETKQVRRLFAYRQSRRSFALQSKSPSWKANPCRKGLTGITSFICLTFVAASVQMQVWKSDWSSKGFQLLDADF